MRRYESLIRILRSSRTPDSDTKRLPLTSYNDIYGADVYGTLESDFDMLQMIPAGRLSQRFATVALDAGKDVQPGYLLAVYKCKVVWRTRSRVSATVSPNPSLGATELTVDTLLGFQGGDHCLLQDGSGNWSFRLKSVTEATSKLNLHDALPRAFTSATVEAMAYWLVTKLQDRPSQSEFQYVQAVYSPLEDPGV